MALKTFPDVSKRIYVSDETSYAYVSIPPAYQGKPTVLLLHGFPSSSWDWRHIIVRLKKAGYGIIAPDLLGYGDSDKPVELEDYAMKRMCRHIVEILDEEGLDKCVGVAHDCNRRI
ncbi:predicted protein [Uncinocarpus reesii 1704]|uniref:AB hydrolase-1 domain-containing protein n=1 Tax=Uncinocarpus reesii (strain UAMH 1704) TaxID=336963 RepID=C4JZK9_UNCRE|nr:uncharacterized protein UREG_07610 [Uncinocarpus reesii 1704]EEP82745.1 predicted protein [Uncinocarpus reesii 1704]